MNYPIQCPFCPIIVDSMDSYADSKQDLRYHITYRHPGEDEGAPDRLGSDSDSGTGTALSTGG